MKAATWAISIAVAVTEVCQYRAPLLVDATAESREYRAPLLVDATAESRESHGKPYSLILRNRFCFGRVLTGAAAEGRAAASSTRRDRGHQERAAFAQVGDADQPEARAGWIAGVDRRGAARGGRGSSCRLVPARKLIQKG
jgi:hypothetical protein